MKFVRLAIGAVIAIAVVGVIVLTVNNTTKEVDTGKNYQFDILIENIDDFEDIKFSPSNIFVDMKDFVVENGSYSGTTYSYSFNDYNLSLGTSERVIISYDGDLNLYYDINTSILSGSTDIPLGVYSFATDIPKIIPAQVSGVSALLLNLAPLIFVSGILGMLFIVVPKNKED